MRAMWKGVISFGLVTIPARLYRATESRSPVETHLLHASDCRSRIQMRPYCPVDERLVDRGEVERGVEVGRESYVILEPSELEKLPVPNRHRLDLVQFAGMEDARAATRHAQ